jgi:ParB/RepB/Spo0J family partition protein
VSTSPVEQVRGRLPVKELHESPLNPRRTFPEAGLRELADSMGSVGQLAPLVVRPLGDPKFTKGKWAGVDRWEVVCGHRRLRAAKLAGIPELDVVVRLMDDDTARAVMLVENAQREGVSPSEQAAAVGELVAAVGQEEAARQVGWPLSRVRDLMRLASLPVWFLKAVDAGTVPLSTAGVVAKVPGAFSREKAAACVLLGIHFPEDLEGQWNDGDDWREAAAAVGEGFRGEAGEQKVLTVSDTKKLVRTHFSRQLKEAPFSRKSLTLVEAAGSCDACPKRAGNDPDLVRDGVRADICTDPECFELKVQAYRAEEVAKAAKKHGASAWEGEWPKHAMHPRGWCLLDGTVGGSELNDPYGTWKGPKAEQKVSELLDGVFFAGEKFTAFHPVGGKPVLLVRTKDARRPLEAAGLMGKKEKPKAGKASAGTSQAGGSSKAPTEAEPVKLWRVVLDLEALGVVEFDAPGVSSDQALAWDAEDALVEALRERGALRWEEVPAAEADLLDPPGADVRTPPIDEPAPAGPLVSEPAGSLKLADVAGFPVDVAVILAERGVNTLTDLDARTDACKRQARSVGPHNLLRTVAAEFGFDFEAEDLAAAGDALIDHFNTAATPIPAKAAEPKSKAKGAK